MSENTQKQIVVVLSTALATMAATKLAGMLVDEPERRGARDDIKEGLLQASFALVATIASSWIIRDILSKHWES